MPENNKTWLQNQSGTDGKTQIIAKIKQKQAKKP